MLVRLVAPNGDSENGDRRNRGSTDDIRYLAVEPLVSSNGTDIAGKLKMNIPFDIIDGVKLSLLECNVDTEIYTVDIDQKGNGKFKLWEGNNNVIDTSIAEGVDNIQGKWRIDDENDSLTFNISVPKLNEFFSRIDSDSPLVKLNVMFNHYKSKDYLPKWVLDISSAQLNENARVTNLQRLFDYIYDYQRFL